MEKNTKNTVIYYVLVLFLILGTFFQMYLMRANSLMEYTNNTVAIVSGELIFIVFIVLGGVNLDKFLKSVEFWITFIYTATPFLNLLTEMTSFRSKWFPLTYNLEILIHPSDTSIWGFFTGTILINIGLILVAFVWKENKFSDGKPRDIRLYNKIRHPLYTNYFIIILGLFIQWPSIIRLILFPLLIYMNYRLAKKKEKEMMVKFPIEYRKYIIRSSMFVPVIIANFAIIQKIRRNPFLLLSVLLFCSLIISGYILITNIYKGENPKIEGDLNPYMKIPVSLKISCDTETEIPISGDIFHCNIEPSEKKHENSIIFDESFFENNSFSDYSINLSYSTGSLQNYIYSMESIKKHTIVEDVSGFIYLNFPIPIETSGTNFLQFYVNFTNKKTGESLEAGGPSFNFATYKSISQEEYNKRESEKIALFIGLISLSLTISFTSIRHLMDIWDRE